MPTNMVKTPEDEKHWAKAKQIASDEGHEGDWKYVVGVYERMRGKVKKSVVSIGGTLLIKADPVGEEQFYPSNRNAYKTNHRDCLYIPINRLKFPYQTDKALNDGNVRQKMRQIKNGQPMDPVVIGYNYDVHDGHHRVEASKRCGFTHVPCKVGGRNKRRIQAAEGRYRTVWKTYVDATGRVLIKYGIDAPENSHWVTLRGVHVMIDGNGVIIKGPKHMAGKSVSELKQQAKQKAKDTGGKAKAGRTIHAGWEKDQKTPFDTPGIVKARARQEKLTSTHTINTPEREHLRQQVADHLYNNGGYAKADEFKSKNRQIKQGKRIDLVIGPPAAGKSTALAEPLADTHGSMVIDSDEAKQMLPEFDKGNGAGAVHEESSHIIEGKGGVFERALKNGDNIVMPMVGKSADKLREMRDHLKDQGYEVHLHLNHLAKDKTTERAIARFHSQNRFVDPNYVYNGVGDKPLHAYHQLKEEGGFDSYEAYSNDVPKGQSPKLLDRHIPEKRTKKSVGSGRVRWNG